MAKKSILHRLFGSNTRAKLLVLFFGNPDREYFVRELERVTEECVGSVQRQVRILEELGLIACVARANAKFYRANKDHFLFQEMTNIVTKTTGGTRE